MSEFLLEILAEEIPAGVLSQARSDLLRGLADALAAERIEGTFFAHSTSRRLVLFSRDLPEAQQDHEVEAVGPSLKVAYDAEGRPTRAAAGNTQSPEHGSQKVQTSHLRREDLLALLKLCWRQGVVAGYRGQFWRQLIGVFRQNPSRITKYLNQCAVGENLFQIRETLLARVGRSGEAK